MLPYTEINPDAAFSAAFVSVGMHWASYIVAVGALLGITTGAALYHEVFISHGTHAAVGSEVRLRVVVSTVSGISNVIKGERLQRVSHAVAK